MEETLHDVVASVERRRRTLTVTAPATTTPLVAALRERFETRNVDVDHETVPRDGPRYATVSADGEHLARLPLAALRDALAEGAQAADGGDRETPSLFDHLDGTTFTGWDRRQLLYTSREIEDRAWRMRAGSLYAGFQTLSTFGPERDLYRTLAETDLSVHVYGAPDADVGDVGAVTVHPCDAPAVRDTWFVVYDGAGRATQKSALIAEERAPGRFFGVWTYDPAVVDDALTALRRLDGRSTRAAGDDGEVA